MNKYNITLIGYGRLGSCLATQLIKKEAGLKYIVSHNAGNKGLFKDKLTESVISESDVIIICVQDKNIPEVVSRIMKIKIPLEGKMIFHTSGLKTSDELKKLKGAETGSFHPAQAFAKGDRNKNMFRGVYVALEGSEKFISFAKKLTKMLQAKYFIIRKEQKILYHLLCVFSSNYIISYFSLMDKIAGQASLPDRWFEIIEPLLQKTLNDIRRKKSRKSLTGPLTRGDLGTIKEHLNYTGNNSLLNGLYKILGSEASEIAYESGDITKLQYQKIKRIFK